MPIKFYFYQNLYSVIMMIINEFDYHGLNVLKVVPGSVDSSSLNASLILSEMNLQFLVMSLTPLTPFWKLSFWYKMQFIHPSMGDTH